MRGQGENPGQDVIRVLSSHASVPLGVLEGLFGSLVGAGEGLDVAGLGWARRGPSVEL